MEYTLSDVQSRESLLVCDSGIGSSEGSPAGDLLSGGVELQQASKTVESRALTKMETDVRLLELILHNEQTSAC